VIAQLSSTERERILGGTAIDAYDFGCPNGEIAIRQAFYYQQHAHFTALLVFQSTRDPGGTADKTLSRDLPGPG